MEIVREIFLPDERASSVEAIRLEQLWDRGYRTLIVDIDNTLVTYDQRTMSLQKQTWVHGARSIGFEIYALSNNSRYKRMEKCNAPG